MTETNCTPTVRWEEVGPNKRVGERGHSANEYSSLVYDSKRNRLIYLQGEVDYFSLDEKKWTSSGVRGLQSRDAVYVPGQDAVVAYVKGGFRVFLCEEEKIVDGPPLPHPDEKKKMKRSENAVTIDPVTETVLWVDVHRFTGPFTLQAMQLDVDELTE